MSRLQSGLVQAACSTGTAGVCARASRSAASTCHASIATALLSKSTAPKAAADPGDAAAAAALALIAAFRRLPRRLGVSPAVGGPWFSGCPPVAARPLSASSTAAIATTRLWAVVMLARRTSNWEQLGV